MLVKRVTATGGNDLRTVYRPCSIDELLGNEHVKKVLSSHIHNGSLDHTILLSGPSGCGKTTLARILALTVNCETFTEGSSVVQTPCLKCNSCTSILNQNSLDYQEVNVGSSSGKADVDDIVKGLSMSAFSATNKIIVFDECHKLSPAAKDLLLKKMEDTYSHVYLIFCTNQPEKLADAKKGEEPFLDRCAHYVLKPLDAQQTYAILENICQFEGVPYTIDILNYIVGISKGVPRKALKSLGAVIAEGSWEPKAAQALLEGILVGEDDPGIMELSTTMLARNVKGSYAKMAGLLKKHESETIRVAVAGFLVYKLKTTSDLAHMRKLTSILDFFTVPIYSTGKPGEHLLYNYVAKSLIILSSH